MKRMYFDDNYRRVGAIDIAPLQEAVRALGEADWNASTERQKTFKVHARTRTIQLIYDEDMRHADPTRHPAMDRMEPLLEPAMRQIRSYFAPMHEAAGTPIGEGYFIRIVLVRLAAGAEINSHTDTGTSLMRTHRVHLPIMTNDGVLFAVRGDIRHLPAGELWEINNRRPHAVRNGGEDRIHAILDYVVPGERIEDPDGLVFA